MATSKITIEYVKSTDGKWGTMYSFKGSDGEWYSAGKKKPPEKGTYVEVTWEEDDKGYKKVKAINRLQAQEPTQNVARAAVGGSRNLTKDDYWTRKEERDVAVQARIELQSCRNSALELVKLMLQPNVEAVPLPKAKAEREVYVAEVVDHYTQLFLKQNNEGFDKAAVVEDEPQQEEQEEVEKQSDDAEEWS